MIHNLCARCGGVYATDKWQGPWLCKPCDDGTDITDPIGSTWQTSG